MMQMARWRKASTREQCIALYPGSNPGRASSLRRASRLRLGRPLVAPKLEERRRKMPVDGGVKTFRGCEIWSKDHPRARGNPALWLEGRAAARPFFVPDCQPLRLDAQTNRHLHHPDHRRRSHRDRAGLRIRLFGHAGGQDAEGGRLPDRAGQFQSGHDHDRSRTGRRHLYRADHARRSSPRSSRRNATSFPAALRCCRPWADRPR